MIEIRLVRKCLVKSEPLCLNVLQHEYGPRVTIIGFIIILNIILAFGGFDYLWTLKWHSIANNLGKILISV